MRIACTLQYKAIEFNPKKLFERYDEDNSGSIDQDELEDLLYDLGIRLTTENLRSAHAALGLKKESDMCKWEAFEPWWWLPRGLGTAP